MNKTCELLKDAPDSDLEDELSEAFKNHVNKNLVECRSYMEKFSLIDTKTIQMAYTLTTYFNANLIVLEGFDLKTVRQGFMNGLETIIIKENAANESKRRQRDKKKLFF